MKKIISCSLFILLSYFGLAQNIVREHLDINQIKAGFMTEGDMFWNPATGAPDFEYPKGSGKHCNFGNVLWIGGKNKSNGTLHMAAQGWRSRGSEYWPGPLNTQGEISKSTSKNWDQIWKINRTTIDSFLQIEKHTEANTAQSILQWPAQGNVRSKTPTGKKLNIPNRAMAPFVDANHDGIYNALDGDYPDIKGEQMLWWIMNDKLETHVLSQAPALGIEIMASAFACNVVGFENSIFLHLEVTNHSDNIYDSTVVALFSEGTIGALDDFIGFDSTRRMGIMYNGDAYDEGFSNYAYDIPQMGTILLLSPQDSEYKREPVGAFTFFTNGGGPTGDPALAAEHYNYMTGYWKDGLSFNSTCDPRSYSPNSNSPYVFPGDPQEKNSISEPTCNHSSGNRRFVLSSKPFTLKKNESSQITYAFLAANMGGNAWDFKNIRSQADQLFFNHNTCENFKTEPTPVNIREHNLKIYPNPVSTFFVIEDASGSYKKIKLFTPLGQLIYENRSKDMKIEIATKGLQAGIYFLKLEMNDQIFFKRILIN